MDNNTETIYSGVLRKKGGRVNVWSERFFVLKGYTLYYYVKSTDSVSYYSYQMKFYDLMVIFLDYYCCNRNQKDHSLYSPHVKYLPSHRIQIKSVNNIYLKFHGKLMMIFQMKRMKQKKVPLKPLKINSLKIPLQNLLINPKIRKRKMKKIKKMRKVCQVVKLQQLLLVVWL